MTDWSRECGGPAAVPGTRLVAGLVGKGAQLAIRFAVSEPVAATSVAGALTGACHVSAELGSQPVRSRSETRTTTNRKTFLHERQKKRIEISTPLSTAI